MFSFNRRSSLYAAMLCLKSSRQGIGLPERHKGR